MVLKLGRPKSNWESLLPFAGVLKQGLILRGIQIGKKPERAFFVWAICPICKKERWRAKGEINIKKRQNSNLNRCHKCAVSLRGAECVNWKGGRRIDKEGYVLIYVSDDDFFSSMRNNAGYVREHRLVMAKHLGRCLHRWEMVHHKNHIKGDNRIENLQLISDTRHNQITILEKRIHYLEDKVLSLGGKP